MQKEIMEPSKRKNNNVATNKWEGKHPNTYIYGVENTIYEPENYVDFFNNHSHVMYDAYAMPLVLFLMLWERYDIMLHILVHKYNMKNIIITEPDICDLLYLLHQTDSVKSWTIDELSIFGTFSDKMLNELSSSTKILQPTMPRSVLWYKLLTGHEWIYSRDFFQNSYEVVSRIHATKIADIVDDANLCGTHAQKIHCTDIVPPYIYATELYRSGYRKGLFAA